MSAAQHARLPRPAGPEWVALSEAAAAIVRSIPAPQPPRGRQPPDAS